MNLKSKHNKGYFKLNKTKKIFGLLIISTIIIHIGGWALDWKFGKTFFPLSKSSVIYSELFAPGFDGGYFEHYQYILLIWCGLLSASWIYSKKFWEAFSIPIIYIFLFLDDSLQFHDRFEGNIFNIFTDKQIIFFDNFLKVRDFSELIYWFLVFIIIILISFPAIIKKNNEIRSFIFKNYMFYFSMAFFGIFIDFIGPNTDIFLYKVLMILFEEIGEITTIALSCIWLFNLNFNNQNYN